MVKTRAKSTWRLAGFLLVLVAALGSQAERAAYEGSERPKGFQGQVYLPVDCR
ncbi:hypothetical protein JRI60_44230 [Archangium violaceum]|uniref:hypothetical protein n=1 Tax=Archangium violaceum TaxID=83451 RepID=UPI00195121BC|nr:hypothetical protein [Archangium violaceum]QRO03076.1 hypothetical protein JRI60_44230 [Archangium violaceum]